VNFLESAKFHIGFFILAGLLITTSNASAQQVTIQVDLVVSEAYGTRAHEFASGLPVQLSYTVDPDAADSNPDPSAGVFADGLVDMSVSIPAKNVDVAFGSGTLQTFNDVYHDPQYSDQIFMYSYDVQRGDFLDTQVDFLEVDFTDFQLSPPAMIDSDAMPTDVLEFGRATVYFRIPGEGYTQLVLKLPPQLVTVINAGELYGVSGEFANEFSTGVDVIFSYTADVNVANSSAVDTIGHYNNAVVEYSVEIPSMGFEIIFRNGSFNIQHNHPASSDSSLTGDAARIFGNQPVQSEFLNSAFTQLEMGFISMLEAEPAGMLSSTDIPVDPIDYVQAYVFMRSESGGQTHLSLRPYIPDSAKIDMYTQGEVVSAFGPLAAAFPLGDLIDLHFTVNALGQALYSPNPNSVSYERGIVASTIEVPASGDTLSTGYATLTVEDDMPQPNDLYRDTVRWTLSTTGTVLDGINIASLSVHLMSDPRSTAPDMLSSTDIPLSLPDYDVIRLYVYSSDGVFADVYLRPAPEPPLLASFEQRAYVSSVFGSLVEHVDIGMAVDFNFEFNLNASGTLTPDGFGTQYFLAARNYSIGIAALDFEAQYQNGSVVVADDRPAGIESLLVDNVGVFGGALVSDSDLNGIPVNQHSINFRSDPSPSPDMLASAAVPSSALDFDLAFVSIGEGLLVLSPTPVVIDSDLDGIPDHLDSCPNSYLSETVILRDRDSGVSNYLMDDGCTVTDQIVAQCKDVVDNHGSFVSCVSAVLNELRDAGVITGRERGAIQSAAAGH